MQILTRFNKIVAYSEHGYTPVGNTAVCAVTNECYDDALIVTVDCVPTDIDYYDYYYINGKFVKGGTKSELRETHHNKKMAFWIGTTEEYNAIPEEEIIEDCLYLFTDDPTPGILKQLITKSAWETVNDDVGLEAGTYEVIYETADKILELGIVTLESGKTTILPLIANKVSGWDSIPMTFAYVTFDSANLAPTMYELTPKIVDSKIVYDMAWANFGTFKARKI